jgi:predicted lipoprotein with Yx(FWY)xxD motif
MRKRLLLIPAMALVVAACGGGDDAAPSTTQAPATAATPTTATPTTGSPAAADEIPVAVVSSDLGDILADDHGNTLYLFLPDAQGPSVCNGDCAGIWPPLTVTAAAGDGVDAALLGTVTRDDGSEQTTYNGWPLYYFASDAAAGDTNGQGVNDVWYVVDPAGDAVGQ